MRLRLTGLLFLVCFGALTSSARAQTTISTTERQTSLSAGSGVLLFSAWDDQAQNYRLLQRTRGQITPVPVAPSARPFQADVGPTTSGHAYYVYSRCAAAAGSCDLYAFNPETGTELRSKASDPKHDDLLPTYWEGRLAFVRDYGTSDRPQQIVYNRPNGDTSRSERLPGLPAKRCDKGECIDPRGRFEAMELSGDRLAQTAFSQDVSVFPTNAKAGQGPKFETFREDGVELRLVDRGLERSRRLARSGQGEGAQDFSGVAFDGGRLYAGFTCVSCGRLEAGIYRYAYTNDTWAFAPESSNVKTFGLAVDGGTFFRVRNVGGLNPQTDCSTVASSPGITPLCNIDQATDPEFSSIPAPSDRPPPVLHPVVVYHRPASGPTYFETIVRLPDPAPRQTNGSVLAGATVNGFGPDLDFASGSDMTGGFTTIGKRSRRCYVQSTFNLLRKAPSSLASPRRGQKVRVSVLIDGQPARDTSARLIPGGKDARRAVEQLGC